MAAIDMLRARTGWAIDEEGTRVDRSPVTKRLGIGFVAAALACAIVSGSAVAGGTGGATDDAYPSGGDLLLEDQSLAVPAPGVLANDEPLLGSKCVTDFHTDELDGSLGSSAEDGSFTFTPAADFHGTTSFTYDKAALVAGVCSDLVEGTATVTITVTPVNDPPTAVLGGVCDGSGVTVAEDSGAFDDGPCVTVDSFGPKEGGQGLDGWTLATNHPELFAAGPSITVSGSANGRLAFTPAPNAHGSALVTVRARDDGGTAGGGTNLSNGVEFSITITPVNDAPTAVPDTFFVLVDRPLTVNPPGVLSNDSDIDGDSLTAKKVSSPAHGVLTLAADGGFTYTPASEYTGLDAFSYRAFDGTDNSAIRLVTLNVSAIPIPTPTTAPPTAVPSAAPSAEATVAPLPSGSPEPSASIDPNASPPPSAAATAAASGGPGSTPAPEPTAGSGGLSIPVLVVLLLFLSLLAFGAAYFVPKWLESRRNGNTLD